MSKRKKVLLIVLAFVLLSGLGGFAFVLYKDRSYTHSPAYRRQAKGPSKVLVVYYSRSGNTESVARTIAKLFDADMLRIEAPRYSLDYAGWRNAANDADAELTDVAISHPPVDLERYRLVFVGSPVWWYRPAPPLWAFVGKSKFAGTRVVLFTTFNSRFKDVAITHFGKRVELSGGHFLDHVFVQRGRVIWQKSPEQVRSQMRDRVLERFPMWRHQLGPSVRAPAER